MSRSSRSLNPRCVTAAAALVAACAACAAWPLAATAQQSDTASPTAASSPSADNPQNSSSNDESDVPSATRQASDDERRLLGGPGASFDPYSSDSASPEGQEDELMSEQRMKIVNPAEFYQSGSPAGVGAPGEAGGAGGGAGSAIGGTGGAKGGFGGTPSSTGMSGSGKPSNDDPMYDATGTKQNYDDGVDTSSSLYHDPYESSSQAPTAAQPYRLPW